VLSAEWDNAEQKYHITIQDVLSGAISMTNAEVVVSAIGILEVPRCPPSLEGISDYKGESFHSARWNHDLDLRGKRVAVIGNGCSAYVAYLIP
jgi:cation diffusion facilitator CzcD-associated flavoprotein CzcO